MSSAGAPRLEGKVALVTGAGRGIGAAISRRFAEEGARLVLTDADAASVEAVAAAIGEQTEAHAHDVTSEEAWRAAVGRALETHGQIDVLVNNAGVFFAAPLAETALDDFRRLQEVNQVGVFLGMREVAPSMVARGSGSIINMSSVAGVMGSPLLTAYAASKWAVRGMTKAVARELAGSGVRVNSIHPGQIDTDMHARQRERTPELIDRLVAQIPMRRIGDPREVADAAVYLAADESRFVTGGEIVIDGGVSA
jgi:3alpha(or 20beta)-hydroxysteroid dehydrogenase